jgi:hypothetical protein
VSEISTTTLRVNSFITFEFKMRTFITLVLISLFPLRKAQVIL